MKLSEIARQFEATIIGNADIDITQLCSLDKATASGLSFLSNPKFSKYMETTTAGAVFVSEHLTDIKTNATLLVVKNPYLAFCLAGHLFYSLPKNIETGIHPSAVIEGSARISDGCRIGANVYIGANCTIGKNALIYPNVVIMEDTHIGDDARIYPNVSIRENCRIGDRVTIHAGAVIGADGFGFAPNPPVRFEKILQMGRVRIENDVEIGANSCIDRAAMTETVIGEGTKLDNLVQIGHNVEIGKHNVFSGHSAVGGSTKIGDWNFIGGGSAFPDSITIGNANKFGGRTSPVKDVGHQQEMMGIPAIPVKEYRKIQVSQKYLPDMKRQLRELQKQVKQLETMIYKKID